MDGRKIPSFIENPFDNVLIDISAAINPYLRKLGLHQMYLQSFHL
jgi:hypothetical protein